jgi:transcriptional regulator with XRE-family HTH domain
MDQPKLFGKCVKAARKRAKLTQEKLAEAAHLNPKYLGQIERGEKSPSFEVIVALAGRLDVSPAVFFSFEREETDEKALRTQIESLLQKGNVPELRMFYRLAKAMVEP